MKDKFQILVWQEPPYFIAKCLDLSVASQGKTREEALARVRALPQAEPTAIADFQQHFERACFNLSQWHSEHPIQIEKLKSLRADLESMSDYIAAESLADDHPWDRFYHWAEETLSLEGQEQLVSLLLEPYGELVDELIVIILVDSARPGNAGLGFKRYNVSIACRGRLLRWSLCRRQGIVGHIHQTILQGINTQPKLTQHEGASGATAPRITTYDIVCIGIQPLGLLS